MRRIGEFEGRDRRHFEFAAMLRPALAHHAPHVVAVCSLGAVGQEAELQPPDWGRVTLRQESIERAMKACTYMRTDPVSTLSLAQGGAALHEAQWTVVGAG